MEAKRCSKIERIPYDDIARVGRGSQSSKIKAVASRQCDINLNTKAGPIKIVKDLMKYILYNTVYMIYERERGADV